MKSRIFSAVLLSITLLSCKENSEVSSKKQQPNNEKTTITHVMTKEQQEALTPDQVLNEFIDGNKRFNTGNSIPRDLSMQARKSAPGQYPKAVVLSCLDSRVPVEDVFDQGLGDIFVGRVAGNFVNEDLLGSMEFACKVAGAKLIVVMGTSTLRRCERSNRRCETWKYHGNAC